MTQVDVPLLGFERLHQLGGKAVGAKQQQRNTGLLPCGIEA